jgi:molecular chaperone GrpE
LAKYLSANYGGIAALQKIIMRAKQCPDVSIGNLLIKMKLNLFKDSGARMKKKEHKENTKGNKEQSVELNAEIQKDTDLSSSAASDSEEPVITEEVIAVPDEKEQLEAKIVELEGLIKQGNDKYLRLSAEFDNYRKRTLRERMELTKTAGESVMLSILPVIDDFERAMHSIDQGMDFEATKEGILLIYNKFQEFNKQNGISEIEAANKAFDTDLHEALTKIPAPSEEMKGKIIDVIQKGYYLNGKVIRFAKVVVGE